MVGAVLLTRAPAKIAFGVAASWTPARRAAGLDPALVQRGD
jgi:ABC-type lipoprotein release transport system permease subunit